jgi:hypothetical protein
MCIRSHVDNAVALVETGKEDPISLWSRTSIKIESSQIYLNTEVY